MTKASIATTMAEQENYGKPANKLCREMICPHLFNWTKLRCKRVWRAKIKILDFCLDRFMFCLMSVSCVHVCISPKQETSVEMPPSRSGDESHCVLDTSIPRR